MFVVGVGCDDANGSGLPDRVVDGGTPRDGGVLSRADGAVPLDDGARESGADASHFDAAAVPLDSGARESGADASRSDAAGLTCEGDRWLSKPEGLEDCAVITGNLSLTGDPTRISLPQLRTVGGFLTVWGNASLVEVDLPLLTSIGSFLDISANPRLAVIKLPSLENANTRHVERTFDVGIFDNEMLPTCEAEAVRTQLTARGYQGVFRISENLGTCSP